MESLNHKVMKSSQFCCCFRSRHEHHPGPRASLVRGGSGEPGAGAMRLRRSHRSMHLQAVATEPERQLSTAA